MYNNSPQQKTGVHTLCTVVLRKRKQVSIPYVHLFYDAENKCTYPMDGMSPRIEQAYIPYGRHVSRRENRCTHPMNGMFPTQRSAVHRVWTNNFNHKQPITI